MGTKYNSEGYRDPTAHLGIGLAEPEQARQIVRLTYRNGRMELYVKEFFPCTIAVGRKIFPLIKKFAGKKDIENLRMFLEMEVSEHSEKYKEFSRRRGMEAEGFDIVCHVHDEVVLEVPEGRSSVDEINEIMAVNPEWTDGLPLKAAGFESPFYKKD